MLATFSDFGEFLWISLKKPSHFLTRKNPKYENAWYKKKSLFIIISVVRMQDICVWNSWFVF
jgi:hypothetical protein